MEQNEYQKPENWGDKPEFSREQALEIASDIYSRGNSELANTFIDAYDNDEAWVTEHLRKYYGIREVVTDYFDPDVFDPNIDGVI